MPNTEVARTFQSKTLVSQNSTLAVDGSRHTCSMITGVNKTEHAWWRMVLAKPFLVYKIELLFKPDEAIGHLMFYWQPRMFVEVTFYESFEAWLLFDPNFFWHPYMS